VFEEMEREGKGTADLQKFIAYFSDLKAVAVANVRDKEEEFNKKMTNENLTALFDSMDKEQAGTLDIEGFS